MGQIDFPKKLWLSVIVYVAAENVFFVSETSSAEILHAHTHRQGGK